MLKVVCANERTFGHYHPLVLFTSDDIYGIIYAGIRHNNHNYFARTHRRYLAKEFLMASKSNTQNAHNGKQGNSTRLELFIALKYLLEKCPDEKHVSKTVELQQYAEDTFGVLLDRRRVNDIFDSLVKLTNENPDVLPYVVKQVDNKPRYYIKKTLFTNKEIESIARAIQNDQSISYASAVKYVDAFLNVSCNQIDKDRINKKLKKTEMRKPRISDSEMQIKEYFEWLRDTQKRFYFKFKKRVRPGDCTDFDTYKKLVCKKGIEEDWAGIVFDLYTNKKQVDACIYLPDLHSAIIAHLQDVEINKGFEPTEQWNTVSFYIGENKKLEEWVNNYYKGETGIIYPIKFAFPEGDNQTILKKLDRSFFNFFGERMKYECKERKVTVELPNGEIEEETVVDIIASTKHNYESFKKWYWEGEDKPYETVVVLFPAAFNDRLLGPITRRFQARLNNFGYDSEHGKAERQAVRRKIEEKKNGSTN